MDYLDERIEVAFKDSAFGPEMFRGTCWIAYLADGTAVVCPERDDIIKREDLPDHMWNINQTYYLPTSPHDPSAAANQQLADMLEKYAEGVCVAFEAKSPRWIGRMTTAALGFKDVTDWHEAATKEALVKELIDAYA